MHFLFSSSALQFVRISLFLIYDLEYIRVRVNSPTSSQCNCKKSFHMSFVVISPRSSVQPQISTVLWMKVSPQYSDGFVVRGSVH